MSSPLRLCCPDWRGGGSVGSHRRPHLDTLLTRTFAKCLTAIAPESVSRKAAIPTSRCCHSMTSSRRTSSHRRGRGRQVIECCTGIRRHRRTDAASVRLSTSLVAGPTAPHEREQLGSPHAAGRWSARMSSRRAAPAGDSRDPRRAPRRRAARGDAQGCVCLDVRVHDQDVARLEARAVRLAGPWAS